MPFNSDTALRLSKVCLWACDFDESRERELLLLDGQEPINVATFADSKSVPTSFAAIVEYESEIVLVFQGTINDFGREGVFSWDSLVDWIHNFRFQQVAAEKSGLPGRVHEGFLEQLNLIYDQLVSALSILKHKPVYITGHSQGGAIASLATKRLTQDKFDVTDTYTFGAPRAASSAFSRSVQSPYHRVEFGHDIVPHVPPALSQSSILNSGLSALERLFDMPDIMVALKNLSRRINRTSYHSPGSLTYKPELGLMKSDLDASEERQLDKARKRQLLVAGKALIRHHGIDNYIRMFQ